MRVKTLCAVGVLLLVEWWAFGCWGGIERDAGGKRGSGGGTLSDGGGSRSSPVRMGASGGEVAAGARPYLPALAEKALDALPPLETRLRSLREVVKYSRAAGLSERVDASEVVCELLKKRYVAPDLLKRANIDILCLLRAAAAEAERFKRVVRGDDFLGVPTLEFVPVMETFDRKYREMLEKKKVYVSAPPESRKEALLTLCGLLGEFVPRNLADALLVRWVRELKGLLKGMPVGFHCGDWVDWAWPTSTHNDDKVWLIVHKVVDVLARIVADRRVLWDARVAAVSSLEGGVVEFLKLYYRVKGVEPTLVPYAQVGAMRCLDALWRLGRMSAMEKEIEEECLSSLEALDDRVREPLSFTKERLDRIDEPVLKAMVDCVKTLARKSRRILWCGDGKK